MIKFIYKLKVSFLLVFPILYCHEITLHADPTLSSSLTATDLQSEITSAYKSGDKRYTLREGIYHLDKSLLFPSMKDFTIEAKNATLIFTQPNLHIVFRLCENVTFTGATIIHDPIPFSQGRVESIAPDQKTFQIRIDKGYPYQCIPRLISTFDHVTRHFKPGTHDLGVGANGAREIEPGLLEISYNLGHGSYMGHVTNPQHVDVGDLMAWGGTVVDDLCLDKCHKMKLVDITVKSGSGFCFHEAGGEGDNLYDHCTITYGPPPTGATEPPLFASTQDGLHSHDMRHGPTVDSCLFEGMNDDGIAIHGRYGFVEEVQDNHMVINGGIDFCRSGDLLRFTNSEGVIVGEAKVLSVAPNPEYHPDMSAPVDPAFIKSFRNPQYMAAYKYCTVTCDPPIPAGFGDVVSNSNTLGSNFIIRHCTIRNNRSRGMLIKADNGLIEDNTVEGCSGEGIQVGPQITWNEACYAHNLIIRNNTIRHVGVLDQPWNGAAGAMTITAFGAKGCVPLPGGFKNITVDGNTFLENDGVNLMITSAQGVVVSNNHFIKPMQSVSDRGAFYEIDPHVLIWLSEIDNIRFDNNDVVNPGGEFHHFLYHTNTVINSTFPNDDNSH
jgi:hypothetical protein